MNIGDEQVNLKTNLKTINKMKLVKIVLFSNINTNIQYVLKLSVGNTEIHCSKGTEYLIHYTEQPSPPTIYLK